jgi:transposase
MLPAPRRCSTALRSAPSSLLTKATMPIAFARISGLKVPFQTSPTAPIGRRSSVGKGIYRERNHVERFFNKLKQFRRIATRYDKLGATFFAFIKIAAVRIWLRSIESKA